MNPQKIYEAISYSPSARLKDLAERCLDNAEARVTRPPEPTLVMARVRETVDREIFNLGEVLVTTCEVTLGGEPGWGMILGHDAERALCTALVDAASRLGDTEDLLREELAGEYAAACEARKKRWTAVQPTRVEFEEMA